MDDFAADFCCQECVVTKVMSRRSLRQKTRLHRIRIRHTSDDALHFILGKDHLHASLSPLCCGRLCRRSSAPPRCIGAELCGLPHHRLLFKPHRDRGCSLQS
eukprot:jgi/Ulvmu1/1037/UM104_0023.1